MAIELVPLCTLGFQLQPPIADPNQAPGPVRRRSDVGAGR
jgi:hypothetical protein